MVVALPLSVLQIWIWELVQGPGMTFIYLFHGLCHTEKRKALALPWIRLSAIVGPKPSATTMWHCRIDVVLLPEAARVPLHWTVRFLADKA